MPAHVQELDGLLRLFRDKVSAGDAPNPNPTPTPNANPDPNQVSAGDAPQLPLGAVAIAARHTLLLPRCGP